MSDRLFVGIGNKFRRDDGVGPLVVDRLIERGATGVLFDGDGTGLIDLFQSHDNLVLIDATHSGAVCGTMVEIDAIAQPLRADLFRYSTHRFGLAEAVETARTLEMLPARLRVFGVEGGDFSAGTELSPAVAQAADALVDRLSASAS